jgi:hypothetical protein
MPCGSENFWRNILPPSSRPKGKPSKKTRSWWHCFHTHCHENLVPKFKSLAREETYPELLGFVLCPSSGILEARKRNVSEAGSVPILG